jgi:hypothetical protein
MVSDAVDNIFRRSFFLPGRHGPFFFLTGICLWIFGILLLLNSVISGVYPPFLIGITAVLFFGGFSLVFAGMVLLIPGCDRRILFFESAGAILIFLGMVVITSVFSHRGIPALLAGLLLLLSTGAALLLVSAGTAGGGIPEDPLVARLLKEFDEGPGSTLSPGSDFPMFRARCVGLVRQIWEREKDRDDAYNHLLDDLLLFLDHLENSSTGGTGPQPPEWAYKKMRNILFQNGIEDLPVGPAARFAPDSHTCVGTRPSAHERGTILSVSRRGYVSRGRSAGRARVLRRAEVIVSSGAEGPETGERVE